MPNVGFEPSFIENFLGDHPDRNNDESGHDHRVVKMSKDRDKIGNEIKRQKQVSNRQREHDFGQYRSPAIFKHKPIHLELGLERFSYGS